MRIGLWPFYGQQDKLTGRHLLDTCGSTKQATYIERRLRGDGHSVRAMVPNRCQSPFYDAVHTWVPQRNPVQLVHQDVAAITEVFRGCSVAVLWHEYLASAVRAVYQDIRIVQICAVDPRDRVMRLLPTWVDANVVVVQTKTAAQSVESLLAYAGSAVDIHVWPMCFRTEDIVPSREKDVDVLFVPRCSVTNYSHHAEFLGIEWGDVSVEYTDVTRYLRKQRPDLRYTDTPRYYERLASAKVAVAMVDDLFGGQAIREAIVSGCVPVVLDVPHYRELVGEDWPFTVKADFSNLEAVVRRAVRDFANIDTSVPLRNALAQSYDNAWEAVKCTILQ